MGQFEIDARNKFPYGLSMVHSASAKRQKSWRPKTPYRLVAIEWEDSQRPSSPWQWLDEFGVPDAVLCVSVGFLVAQSDTALALAPNLGDVECARAQASGIISIPASAVRRMVDL